MQAALGSLLFCSPPLPLLRCAPCPFQVDFKTSSTFGETGKQGTASVEGGGIPAGMMGLDCGPKSIAMNNEVIMSAKTIIWNGPMVRRRTPSQAANACSKQPMLASGQPSQADQGHRRQREPSLLPLPRTCR